MREFTKELTVGARKLTCRFHGLVPGEGGLEYLVSVNSGQQPCQFRMRNYKGQFWMIVRQPDLPTWIYSIERELSDLIIKELR